MIACAPTAFAVSPSALFDAHGCRSCHKIGTRGGNAGPDLTVVGHRRPRSWIEKWLASPRAFKHDTKMPEQGLNAYDRAGLADFLSQQKGQAWAGIPPWRVRGGAIKGDLIYTRVGCVACHGAGGRGGQPNPGARGDIIAALAPLMATYRKEELIIKIARGAVPETSDGRPALTDMPAWEGVLSADELSALADYLLTLAQMPALEDF